jgi:quercetin dioxygenase-like cupin family protein
MPMEGLPGAQQATLWGDIAKGEHGALYKWPAGTTAPLHWHTNGEHGVVVSGTLTLAPEGGSAKELPAESYVSMAGGTKHATTCTAAADCVFFIHREGKFDVNMVGAAETKK